MIEVEFPVSTPAEEEVLEVLQHCGPESTSPNFTGACGRDCGGLLNLTAAAAEPAQFLPAREIKSKQTLCVAAPRSVTRASVNSTDHRKFTLS